MTTTPPSAPTETSTVYAIVRLNINALAHTLVFTRPLALKEFLLVTLPLSCSRSVWLRAEQVYHADGITEASLVHANEAGSLADDLPLQFGRHGGLQGGEHTAMLSVTGAATTVHMGHSEAARAGILPLVITYVLEWIPKKAAPSSLQPSSARLAWSRLSGACSCIIFIQNLCS